MTDTKAKEIIKSKIDSLEKTWQFISLGESDEVDALKYALSCIDAVSTIKGYIKGCEETQSFCMSSGAKEIEHTNAYNHIKNVIEEVNTNV